MRERPLEEVRLFAVLGTWMEADVVEATVRNAIQQGCERVYLVDNDSPDDTIDIALNAGAELAVRYWTSDYDERLRISIMNEVVRRVSISSDHDHIWWMWLDADEFPQGPRGLTVLEYLKTLDRQYRIVGARFLNHFPDKIPAYISGFHPLEFQQLCEEHAFGCPLGHRKHSLQRFDRSGPEITCERGFHMAYASHGVLLEPEEAILLHHFPFRDPTVTRHRLAALCSSEAGLARVRAADDAADGMVPRFESLEAVYRGDWDKVRNYRGDTKNSIPHPVEWESIAREEERPVRRWYRGPELEAAIDATLNRQGNLGAKFTPPN